MVETGGMKSVRLPARLISYIDPAIARFERKAVPPSAWQPERKKELSNILYFPSARTYNEQSRSNRFPMVHKVQFALSSSI